MNRRLLLASALLAVLTLSAGCMGFFGSDEFSQEQLNRDANYNWNTSSNVTVTVNDDNYRSVYNISNRSTLELHKTEALGEEEPVEVSAVKFRYPNGTVVNASAMEFEKTGSKTVIKLPAENGQLAFTAPNDGLRTFEMQTSVHGSYEVVLPEGMRMGNFLLGDARPNPSSTELVDNRVHIYWDDVTADVITVQYYLARDLLIFGGLLAVLAVVAAVGLGYLWLQVKELSEKRDELGLNVDIRDDDLDDGPPRP